MNKFTNKQEYLAYRTQWKSDYKQLSQRIRDYKWMRKHYTRVAAPLLNDATLNYITASNKINEALNNNERYSKLFKHYDLKQHYQTFYLYGLKTIATQMLLELKEAKIEAQRQYLAEKQSTVCV